MRTTVDIDSALLDQLRREALRRRMPFKHLLSTLLREGLEAEPGRPTGRYRCPTFAMGAPLPGVDLTKALALAATLEDDEVARELEQRK
jgi:hypothetical protein